MEFKTILPILLFSSLYGIQAQVVLNADGPGNTYELINAVLAPGNNVIEAPDCGHTAFNSGAASNPSRHIDEIFDTDLNTNVFRFHIHVTPDNDRCTSATDRQRNEIKTYSPSPANLKGLQGETVQYKWKFKLPLGFQSSTGFTHIHQLKSVDEPNEGTPMITLTTRKSTPDRLELRHAATTTQVTLKQTALSPFLGTWVDVTETITYGASGTYSIIMNKVSDGMELFSYSNNNIITWQTGASFVRPKWGIYRSLDNSFNLRDEQVLFANFSIEENPTLSVSHTEKKNNNISIYPNPAKNEFYLKEVTPNSFNQIKILDNLGRVVSSQKTNSKTVDISNLIKGLYFVQVNKDNTTISVQKLLVE